MRRTKTLVKIASALMAAPDAQHYGYTLGKTAGVRSGVLYPLLSRLLAEGWLVDGWENPEVTRAEKRPPRRYYALTPDGRAALTEILETQ